MEHTWTATALLVLIGLSLGGATVDQNTLSLSSGNTEFAINLYRNVISKANGGNIFMSPISISTALAMVYAGAKGETKQQMAKVLRFQGALLQDDNALHGSFKNLLDIFNDKTNNYTLSLANRLFVENNLALQDKFLQDTQKNYYAGAKKLDFRTKPDPSRLLINDWVASQTNQKIKDLLKQGIITRDTLLVLVNCIYFKGVWKVTFNSSLTMASKFYPISGSPVDMDMMNVKKQKYKYGIVGSLNSTILEIPYGGDEISMYILLPNERNGLANLESKITRPILDTAFKSMRSVSVDLTLPKFKLTQGINLKQLLKQMGMSDLFNPSLADLSAIFGEKGPSVSEVIHKAFVQVDEEGTEAAAATAVIIGRTAVVPPVSFKVEHPFLFFVRENATGSILFLGRITKPSGSGLDGEPTIGDFGGNTSDATSIKYAPFILILACSLALL